MRARIKLTRMHQIHGPDYWEANCYMLEHTFKCVGTTQQQALNILFSDIDRVAFKDWYEAHRLNTYIDSVRNRKLELQLENEERVTVKWSFWNWFK